MLTNNYTASMAVREYKVSFVDGRGIRHWSRYTGTSVLGRNEMHNSSSHDLTIRAPDFLFGSTAYADRTCSRDSDWRIDNAFIQLTGTDSPCDCRPPYP